MTGFTDKRDEKCQPRDFIRCRKRREGKEKVFHSIKHIHLSGDGYFPDSELARSLLLCLERKHALWRKSNDRTVKKSFVYVFFFCVF